MNFTDKFSSHCWRQYLLVFLNFISFCLYFSIKTSFKQEPKFIPRAGQDTCDIMNEHVALVAKIQFI